jgi:hypothetical protein
MLLCPKNHKYATIAVHTNFTGMHCKAGPHRIRIHNISKGTHRYFLRI